MNNDLFYLLFGLISLSFGLLGIIAIKIWWIFDKLNAFEFEHFPEQWKADHEPHGIFWMPKLQPERVLKHDFYHELIRSLRYRLSRLIMGGTPAWVKKHPETLCHLKNLRKLSLIWNIGASVWAVMFLVILLFAPR
jgi:hypothetical protein